MSLAKIFITGKVVKNPEKRFTQNDLPITDFTIDINPQDESLVRVVAIGNQAENIEQNIKAQDTVIVEGRLQTNTVKTTSGKDRKVFEINASTVEKISAQSSSTPSKGAKNENLVQFATEEISEDLIDEDEIPF